MTTTHGSIRLTFRSHFRTVLRDGVKTCTSRTTKLGEVGDRFTAFGATFAIVLVEMRDLIEVGHLLWRKEGATSKQHFVEIWTDIHPNKGFVYNQPVWVHHFRRVY